MAVQAFPMMIFFSSSGGGGEKGRIVYFWFENKSKIGADSRMILINMSALTLKSKLDQRRDTPHSRSNDKGTPDITTSCSPEVMTRDTQE